MRKLNPKTAKQLQKLLFEWKRQSDRYDKAKRNLKRVKQGGKAWYKWGEELESAKQRLWEINQLIQLVGFKSYSDARNYLKRHGYLVPK